MINRKNVVGGLLCSQLIAVNACVFCEKYKHKGNTNLSQILTYTTEHNLKEATKVCSDIQMLLKICEVDLIAQEVKYCASCFSAYTRSKRNLDKFGRNCNDSVSGYTESFLELIQKLMLIVFT